MSHGPLGIKVLLAPFGNMPEKITESKVLESKSAPVILAQAVRELPEPIRACADDSRQML